MARYHLPIYIRDHVDYIVPGVKLSAPLKRSLTKRNPREPRRPPHHDPSWGPSGPWYPPWRPQLPAELQDCGRNITPACIRALYHIPAAPAAVPGNSLGVFEDGMSWLRICRRS